MVGEGVLHECLISEDVDEVLVVSRRPSGFADPKLSEYILNNFFDLSAVGNVFEDFDACFFCLGVSSVGMKKEVYEKMTYDLTIGFAKALVTSSPGSQHSVIFPGQELTPQKKADFTGHVLRARTENELQRLGFRQTFLFRPGILKATQRSKKYIGILQMGGLAPAGF